MSLPSLYRSCSTFISMRMPATIRWAGLAILGLLIAAGVSIAAGSLASQQIGLASEPISAGDSLAPQPAARSIHERNHRHPATATPPERVSPTPPAATPAVEPAIQLGSGQSGDEQDEGAAGGESADD